MQIGNEGDLRGSTMPDSTTIAVLPWDAYYGIMELLRPSQLLLCAVVSPTSLVMV